MTSNGPYYQSVQADHTISEELKLAQGMLDYGALAPQASMYPDPNQPQLSNEYHTQQLVDNDAEDHAQLQGLVEAATSAAAQEQIRQRAQLSAFAQHATDGQHHLAENHHHHHDVEGHHHHPVEGHHHHPVEGQHDPTEEEQLASLLRDTPRPLPKRKLSLSPISSADPSFPESTAASERPKRQKRAAPGVPNMLGQEGDQALQQYRNSVESPHHLDARAAGVHSAAALFRPPSDSSKKYTRPPMSKLFASLELSPENFLYLQAAAKQFMLDPEYPERQACVGNRGKGDSDMVKLRLHHCVREFLERDGWGEKYFGENAPLPDEADNPISGQRRKYIWPRDKDRIIALCTPLLRRMVTNERQRQYAVESRKGGSKDKSNDTDQDQETGGNPENNSAETLSNNPPYDPRLAREPACQLYLLNRDTKQAIHGRIDYPLHEDVSWPLLTHEIERHWHEALRLDVPENLANNFFDNYAIKVLTSNGLTTVSNEGEWTLACQDARQAVWLDGVIKVVVECAM